MSSVEDILSKHPFFHELNQSYLRELSMCASTIGFDEGEYLFHEGDPASTFYIIQEGTVAIEMADERLGNFVVETLSEGDIVGWSWLFPPYKWHFEGRAVSLVRGVVFDGKCIRDRMEKNPSMGYEMLKSFSQMIVERLEQTRKQVKDISSGLHAP